MNQKVEFITTDQVKIVADYYAPKAASRKGVVLVHMMPATRNSWEEFAGKLQAVGYHALTIDLRGHGESGGGNFQRFSDAEHQASIRDLEAAAKFLGEKGAAELAVAGASIGANLALQYLAENPETKAAVLLSPGLDYRGIQTPPLAARVSDKSKILFVGAEDDAASMGGSCEELVSELGITAKICFAAGGHGTNLFQTHPELPEALLDFLKQK